MRGAFDVRKKLIEISSDVRLSYPPATVFSNAPLALIQTSLEAQQQILQWVLEDE